MGLVLGMMVMGVCVMDEEDDIWLFQHWRIFTRPYENIPVLEHVDGIQDKLLASDYPGKEAILNYLQACGTPKGSCHIAGILDTLPPEVHHCPPPFLVIPSLRSSSTDSGSPCSRSSS